MIMILVGTSFPDQKVDLKTDFNLTGRSDCTNLDYLKDFFYFACFFFCFFFLLLFCFFCLFVFVCLFAFFLGGGDRTADAEDCDTNFIRNLEVFSVRIWAWESK